jgi:hypothetical protein
MRDIMKRHTLFGFIVILFGTAGLLAACTAPTSAPNEAVIYTQAAQTISVQTTLDAGSTAIAQLTQIAQATLTAVREATFTLTPEATTTVSEATPTIEATATAVPEATPTSQTTPSPTPVPVPCDWAEFVTDVTIPDGTTLPPNQKFTKTWRIKNIGTCTWTTDYDLVFFHGDLMGGALSVPLAGDVPPGSTVDISIDLITPGGEDAYTGYWQLRNAAGVLFGTGPAANASLYVSVTVVVGETVIDNMIDGYCKAQWQNSAVYLSCPTDIQIEAVGFVYRDNAPVLENGSQENEPALITHPDHGAQSRFEMLSQQGTISGIFPTITIEAGDHFKTVIGCLYGYEQCNVLFYLLVQKPNGHFDIIESWQEFYDGKFTRVDEDLSDYAGKDVRLVLVVMENGDSTGDYAFWLHPRIVR